MTTLLGGPLPVEFLLDGDWRPAVLLGWRHEPDGACRVRVQAVVGGLNRAGWVHLAELRLPLPDRETPAPEPRTRPDLLLPGRDPARRTPAPLSPLPVPRSLQTDSGWA